MRRWTLRILICLILITAGAITTVAVAWGGALQWGGGVFEYTTMHLPNDGRARGVSIERDFFVSRAGLSGRIPPEFAERLLSDMTKRGYAAIEPPQWLGIVNAVTGGSDFGVQEVWAAGWPRRALVAVTMPVQPINSGVPFGISGALIVQTEPMPRQLERASVVLPFRPLWLGFVIDTLFYAAIWFGVFFGFASAKRFIRIKRGRCPRCGYDLRGQRLATSQEPPANSQIRCPECGRNHSGD